jgi:RNA polymerase sigma-70 factor (ECF subfamily)
MTGEQFIKQVEGTQRAFRRFLVALCCGDAALADDIAQDAYIKAYLSCKSLNNLDKFNAWLFKIGYNTYLSHKRFVTVFADYEEARNLMSEETTDSQFRYQELYTALNHLPDKERTSVLLFYMEGYSIKEIAELEETSQDAVKQHLSRGRNHLRGLLSKS